MITGAIKSQVDQVWNAFWSGGISNPLEVIEQITYLLFIRRLDDIQTLRLSQRARTKKPVALTFPDGNDAKGRPHDDYRWSALRNMPPREMLTVVSEHVFPFLRTLGGDGSTYAQHMKDARFTISRPRSWPRCWTSSPRFRSKAATPLPYQDNLSALIHEPTFKAVAGEAVFAKARLITHLGNLAVHNPKPVAVSDAVVAVRELFHVGYWLARTYARQIRPDAGRTFDPERLPKTRPLPPQTLNQLQQLAASLRERDEQLAAAGADKSALDEELVRLRAEIAQVKAAAKAAPDTHDYSEAETRGYFIDLLVKEAGWPLDQPRDREYAVSGMPKLKDDASGLGYVDYVLWGRDGKPLGLVEAKRTKRDSLVGLDREAANQALAGFTAGRTLTASQIEFVHLIVNHLTEHGVMSVDRLYGPPFTQVTPRGPEALFSETGIDRPVDVLRHVREAARAA